MKYQHQHIFQQPIPPSIPHSQISPWFIQCLQLPPPFSLHPEPHPVVVQPPQPIRTHHAVILIHLLSSHSPPVSLQESPPHLWLILPLLSKFPHWTMHALLLHCQRYLQASRFPMVSQLTPILHDQSTQLLAVLLFQHSHLFRQPKRSFKDTLSVLTS